MSVTRRLVTYALLVGVEEHQQRLQHHLERVHVLGILGEGRDEAAEGTRGHRGRVFFGEAPEAENGSTAVFEQGRACQAAAEGADGIRGRLLGRRLGLEHSHHLGG